MNEVQKHEEWLSGAWETNEHTQEFLRMRCKNMKSGFQVLGRQMSTLRQQYEKWCKGKDMRTAHTSNDMRHRIR